MPKRDKKPLDSEKKLELAKTIAEKSQSFKKTYNSIEGRLIKVFRSVSTWIDFVLFNSRFSKLVAICLAIILYLIINGGTQGSVFNAVRQVVELENVAVTTNISDSVYEVSGLPETVSVDVKGDAGDVQFVNQQRDSFQVIADLKDFGEGTHEVRFEPLNFSNKVDVSITPNTAVVTIKKKVAKSFTIGYDYINTNELDKIYSLSEPEFSDTKVYVKASEDTINQISYVKALIDLKDVKGDFEQDATIVAYNQLGEKIDVNINPETVNVKVKITTPKKEVPIIIVPEGEMLNDKAIDSYTLDHKTMTIYAPKKVLAEIDAVEIKIPVNKIKGDTSITMPVMLPPQVTKGSVTKIRINIETKEKEIKKIEKVPITIENLDSKFNVYIEDKYEKGMDVNVIGTQSVLDLIKKDMIEVTVDLTSFNKQGIFDVELKASGKNKLAKYSLKKKTIRITLEAK